MRWLAAIGASDVLVGLGLVGVVSAVGAGVLARRLDARPADFGVRIERRVELTASDGVRLAADLYHPDTAGRRPTILVRIPYAKKPSHTLFAATVGRLWAARGYTVMFQGTRGRYDSGGRHHPFRREREDGIDTLRWLARQPWYNGRVGMWGGSYFGYTQWVLADQAEPGPSALMVQIASSDMHGMFYPGGAFALESALYFALRSGSERDEDVDLDALQRGEDGWPVATADERAGAALPFFGEWVLHRERDDYWRLVDGERRAERSRAPVHLMAGWYDAFLPTQLADWGALRGAARPEVSAGSRLVIGPWAHALEVRLPGGVTGDGYRLASLAPSLDWFDRHLLGRARTAPGASVRLFVMGANVWRDEREWPLARARATAYYLASGGHANGVEGDGRLSTTEPATEEPADTFVYNPRQAVPTAGGGMLGPRAGIARQDAIERRHDVLVYTAPPLAADMEVTGGVRAVLWVATSAPHTDFTAKLVDVHPDGAAYNVTDGIRRRAYDRAGAPIEITIDLWPTSMLFRRGHRLRLEVSSSNFPRFDRNPNTGRPIATETETREATQTVHHGLRTPSRLVLPVVPAEGRLSGARPSAGAR